MSIPHLQIFQLQNLLKSSLLARASVVLVAKENWVHLLSGRAKASNSYPYYVTGVNAAIIVFLKKIDALESSCSVLSIEEKQKRTIFNWISIKVRNSLMVMKTNSTETHYHKRPCNLPF